jgi:hypothetical protein
MPIHHTASYPAEPARVLAMLTDEGFLRDYAAALGAQVEELSVEPGDRPRTSLRLRVPVFGVPRPFRRFVGGQIPLADRRTWRSGDEGGYEAEVEVRIEVGGRAAVVCARQTLRAAAEGTSAEVTGEAFVDVPLIGRQAEAAVREGAMVVLRRETEVLRRRLGGPPG